MVSNFNLFSWIVSLFQGFVSMANEVLNFLQKPILSENALKQLENLDLDFLERLLGIADLRQITVWWCILPGLVFVLVALFVKWILDWVL